jgi:hypothetical protein
MVCGSVNVHPLVMEDRLMDEHTRRDAGNNGRSHNASNAVEGGQHDELSRGREAREDDADDRGGGRPALTSREREERWPIG